MPSNHYNTLNVPKTATTEQIKSSYRKLAIKYHPDKCINMTPNAAAIKEEKFKVICEAYSILSDSTTRAEYDRSQEGFLPEECEQAVQTSPEFTTFVTESMFAFFRPDQVDKPNTPTRPSSRQPGQ